MLRHAVGEYTGLHVWVRIKTTITTTLLYFNSRHTSPDIHNLYFTLQHTSPDIHSLSLFHFHNIHHHISTIFTYRSQQTSLDLYYLYFTSQQISPDIYYCSLIHFTTNITRYRLLYL